MRLPIKLIILTALFGLIGCEKQRDNPEVETYINQLKSNSYEAFELPAFKPSDIPALLNYRNSTMVITNFPHNGISSLWVPDCKLGMYVLWTIESIRAVEIKSKYLIGRFPSQNPILALRASPELDLVYDNKSQEEAAKAYNDWWYSSYIIKDKMNIDPLENTDYRWH
ncbi:MAG TPA: DUF4943 family protein [Bacteroidales bacterium]|nr:DUF4943 family protein [Bacteroidales bacterium]